MKKNFVTLIILFASLSILAQQDPQFSHNMFNQMAINPAYAGSQDMICATALTRLQWVGFEGAPQTTVVNINAAINPFGISSGIGFNILNDQFGFNSDLGANLSYAVRIPMQGIGTLAIGVNGGFVNNSLTNVDWRTPDGGQGGGTAVLPQGDQSEINFDLGAGVFFSNNEMYFGLSATHLNQAELFDPTPIQYKRHYYLTGGYMLQMPNPSWEFNPSVFVATDLVTSQLSVTASAIYNKKFWGGVSYRVGEAIVGLIGFELFSGMRIGYAFDFSTTSISGYNSGSHEFMLGYCFTLKKERPPQQYKSIRFL